LTRKKTGKNPITNRVITPQRTYRGRDEIRTFFADLIAALPKATWNMKKTFHEDVLFLEWTADSDRHSVSDGVDTFVFADGMIRAQTVRSTLVPKR
jgi:predicted AlkP superfamily phosphohydrolase/phosphomutase